ncbi:hypothetical protein [Vibrio splendidus]|uniref:Uncharacterized protein n=1 Tax=Vibrio splendidus TaxID=29497 RepID=A0A2N7JSA6_VIBSP|nr:hypothetical protein [Vibrio splendidus]PMM57307.1 hypothetical protein BCT54_21440 [Vibrio splendidus]
MRNLPPKSTDINEEITRTLLLKLADMSMSPGTRQHLIAGYGIPPQKLKALVAMSPVEMHALAKESGVQDLVQPIVERCLGYGIPADAWKYLSLNACRGFMNTFFCVTKPQYTQWTKKLPIKKEFSQRVVPLDKEEAVFLLLIEYGGEQKRQGSFCTEPNVRNLTKEDIYEIAMSSGLSIRAIWHECERWRALK